MNPKLLTMDSMKFHSKIPYNKQLLLTPALSRLLSRVERYV